MAGSIRIRGGSGKENCCAVDKADRSWGSGITEKVVWWDVLQA
jgi:hypothetical protein